MSRRKKEEKKGGMDTAKKVFAIVGNTNSICAKALGGTIIVILQSDYYLFVLLKEG